MHVLCAYTIFVCRAPCRWVGVAGGTGATPSRSFEASPRSAQLPTPLRSSHAGGKIHFSDAEVAIAHSIARIPSLIRAKLQYT